MGILAEHFQDVSLLVVDDQEPLREASVAFFECYGITHIQTAESGNEALYKLEHGHFDVVVTDFQMPNGNGIDLIKNMKKDSALSDIPVIMVSGSNIEKEAYAAGAEAVFRKPADYEAVVAKVDELTHPSAPTGP